MRKLAVGCVGWVLLTGCAANIAPEVEAGQVPSETAEPQDPAGIGSGPLPGRGHLPEDARVLNLQSPPGCRGGCPGRPLSFPPLQSDVPLYELEVEPETLALFQKDPWAPEQPATFRAGTTTLPVFLELRGASARFFPKRSWNLDFHTLRFEGRRRLKLIAEYQDCTLLTEKLAYDLLEALGVPAPRARYVRLRINGQDEGVFLALEAVDKLFLEAHGFADPDATIWRCGWKDCEMKPEKIAYQGDWKRKTNETDPTAEESLARILKVINDTPDPQLAEALAQNLDLDALLPTMAVDALISNNYIEDSESFFIHDRVTGRFSYVPWDLNNADARWWPSYGMGAQPPTRHPLVVFSLLDSVVARRYAERQALYAGYLPVFSNLSTRIALHRDLRARYLDVTRRALNELFTPKAMGDRIDRIYALIAPYEALDPYIDPAKFAAGPRWMKTFVGERAKFLETELQRLEQRRLGLAIEAFDPVAQWVELGNRSSAPISTTGLVLTTDLRRALAPNAPAMTLAPGARVRWTAQELGLILQDHGQLGVFDGKSVVGMLDGVFYGPPGPGQHYERSTTDDEWFVR